MNVQEIAFNLVLQAVGAERVATLFTAARDIFGLGNTNIEKGAVADMTLYTASGSHQLDRMQSASANNPFIGTALQGKVIGIINNKQIHLNN